MHLKPSSIGWIKLLLLSVMLLAMACDGGIKIKNLVVPAGALEDSATVFMKDDNLKLADDYAKIDTGDTVGDGFVMSESTDAELIKSTVSDDKPMVFIRIPKKLSKKEHLFKALSAAAIRLQNKTSKSAKLYHLNIDILNREIRSFGFNYDKARDYYLHAAEKLNEKLKSQDGLVINLDDLGASIIPLEFFKRFSKPTLVVLSSKSMDALKLTEVNEKVEEIFPRGLNPGQIYRLAFARFQRSKALSDETQNKAMAIKLAKSLGAMDPGGSLEGLGRLLKKIEPVMETLPLSTTYQEDILKILSADLNISYPFLVSLNLNAKSLTEIQRTVRENTQAYTEETTKRDKMLLLLSQLLPGILETGLTDLKHKLEGAITDAQNLLIDDAAKNKGELEDSVETAVKKIGDRGQSHISQAAKGIKESTANLVKRAEELINGHTSAAHEELKEKITASVEEVKDFTKQKISQSEKNINDTIDEELKNANNKVIRDLKTALSDAETAIIHGTKEEVALAQGSLESAIGAAKADHRAKIAESSKAINDVTRSAALGLQGRLSDAIAEAIKNINEQQLEQAGLTRDELKKLFAKTEDVVNSNTAKRVLGSQNSIIKEVKNNASEGQAIVNNHTSEEMKYAFDAIENAIKSAIKKGADKGNNRATQELQESIAKLVQKARDQINEHTSVGQEDLGEKLIASGQQVKDFTKDRIAQSQSAIINNNKKLISEAQNSIIKEVKNGASEGQAAVNDHTSQEMRQAFEAIDNAMRSAIKKMAAEGRANEAKAAQELRDSLAKLVQKARDQINEHTSVGQEDLGEKLVASGQDIKDFTKDKISQSQNLITSNANKRISDSQNTIVKEIKNTVSDTEAGVNDHTSSEMRYAFQAIDEAIKAAIKKIGAEGKGDWAKAAQEIKDSLARLVQRARDQINDHTSVGQEDLGEKLVASGQDIKDFTKDKITASQAAINSNSDKRIANAQNTIVKEIKNTVADAEAGINTHSSEEIARAFEAIDNLGRALARKISADGKGDWAKAAQEIKDSLARLVQKARDQINENTNAGQEELGGKLVASGQDIKDFTKDKITASQAAINSNSDKRIANAQNTIVKEIKNTVADAEAGINTHSSEEIARAFEAIDNLGRALARKISADGKADWAKAAQEIKDSLARLVQKARDQINENTNAGQEELGGKLVATGEEIKDFTKDKISTSQSLINENTDKRIADSQNTIIRELKNAVRESEQALNEAIQDKLAKVYDELRGAIKDLDAREAERLDKSARAINGNTNNATQKSYERLSEAIAEAVAVMKETAEQDGALTRDDIGKTRAALGALPATLRLQTRDLLRQMGGRFKNNFILFQNLYQLAVERVVRQAKHFDSPLGDWLNGNLNAGANQQRRTRVYNAALLATNTYQAQILAGVQINGGLIRDSAVTGYRLPLPNPILAAEDVVAMNPAVAQVNGIPVAFNGLNNSQELLDVVNNFVNLENINRAPRPLASPDELNEDPTQELMLKLNNWIKDFSEQDLSNDLINDLEIINENIKMLLRRQE